MPFEEWIDRKYIQENKRKENIHRKIRKWTHDDDQYYCYLTPADNLSNKSKMPNSSNHPYVFLFMFIYMPLSLQPYIEHSYYLSN